MGGSAALWQLLAHLRDLRPRIVRQEIEPLAQIVDAEVVGAQAVRELVPGERRRDRGLRHARASSRRRPRSRRGRCADSRRRCGRARARFDMWRRSGRARPCAMASAIDAVNALASSQPARGTIGTHDVQALAARRLDEALEPEIVEPARAPRAPRRSPRSTARPRRDRDRRSAGRAAPAARRASPRDGSRPRRPARDRSARRDRRSRASAPSRRRRRAGSPRSGRARDAWRRSPSRRRRTASAAGSAPGPSMCGRIQSAMSV